MSDGKIVSYSYNGDGLLVGRTEEGTTKRYYYDGSVIAAEGTVTGESVNLTSRYLYGADGVAYMQAGGINYYYLKNGHGDVTGFSNSAGSLVNQYSYDLWGNAITAQETVHNPFRYSGEYWGNSTKLQYLRARWYDPSTGRFISKDTYEGEITNPLSLNLYTYVKNNPLRYIDPTGHYDAEGYLTGGPNPNLTYEGVMLNANGYYTGESTGNYHDLLDLVGLIPVIGEFADGANAIAYLIEGDYAYALLSSGSMVPIAGWASIGAEVTVKAGDKISDVSKAKVLDNASVFKAACNCFVGGTKVQKDEGEKDIEDIEAGDRVLAKDDETGEMAY